ncbi:hypothetical protein D9V87_04850 [Bacteroidetes/Chlorobi group bacterium MS-B_bin-24]|jgi:hypothetical protein|nr:MAG: hypothetical protein D9V87_04850 [Bacteroidetes/Chlorobi group bacterium MS-B_bin-24]
MELPIEIRPYFTPSQLEKFKSLPTESQVDFIVKFMQRMVKPEILLICARLGIPYFYLGLPKKQFRFEITFGKFIFGWRKIMKNFEKIAFEHNKKLIEELL